MSLFKTLLAETVQEFQKQFGKHHQWGAVAPGRVNLIGEHTDYNDGFVFPMAIERQTVILAASLESGPSKVYSMQTGEMATIITDGTSVPPQKVEWSSYVQGVTACCFNEGLKINKPFCAVINSNVPLGGGLSSSASLEVAMATLVETITGKKLGIKQKPLLCQTAEHEYAKMPCGIMDQFISALGMANHAMLLDCRSQEVRNVPLSDPSISVLIINSNKKHELTGSEYPERRAMCFEAAEQLGVAKLRDADLVMLEKAHIQGQLTQKQYQRAKHVISEDIRTQEMAKALTTNQWERCGELMYQSHFSLSIDYEVSTTELDLLVTLARHLGVHGGVYGSRMTGGGFGGCTVSLVRTSQVNEVIDFIKSGYFAVTRVEPTIFATHPAEGARELVVQS